jgi:DNA-directed RNA polymerase specialized sigma24 family protein
VVKLGLWPGSPIQSKCAAAAAKYSLDTVAQYTPNAAEQFLAVHEALDELRALNPRKAHVVELRYFGGLSLEEARLRRALAPSRRCAS